MMTPKMIASIILHMDAFRPLAFLPVRDLEVAMRIILPLLVGGLAVITKIILVRDLEVTMRIILPPLVGGLAVITRIPIPPKVTDLGVKTSVVCPLPAREPRVERIDLLAMIEETMASRLEMAAPLLQRLVSTVHSQQL